jgi:hypothetical protein
MYVTHKLKTFVSIPAPPNMVFYVVLVNDGNSNSGHSVSSTHVVQPQACHFTNLLVLFETGRQEFCQHGYIQSYRLDFKAHGLYMHQGALDCQILPFTITLPILF